MLSLIEAEAYGGPDDGAIMRAERRPYTIVRRFIPATMSFEDSTYALEVTEDGRFRLKHVSTKNVRA